jgi:DNA-binding transcriptional MocR family regulator
MIIEDDPYWYLQFPSAAACEAEARNLPAPSAAPVHTFKKSSGYPFLDSLVPSYLNIDYDGRVIRLDTFSKTVAPGCRLGWITAQPAIVERIVRISESGTQQPSGFVQSMISELIMGPQPVMAGSAGLPAFEVFTKDG